MTLTSILQHPLAYQRFQRFGGFFGARVRSLSRFLPIESGARVADIGCGPGFILDHLPAGIDYSGFDTDGRYIAFAQSRFGSRGRFHLGLFDDAAARRYGPFDVVMMNGLLHHLNDGEARETLRTVRAALAPGGRLFTLDGCQRTGQSRIARFLLLRDRGRHVRTEEGYRDLAQAHFPSLELHVRDDLSWVPYTWIAMVGRT